MRDGVINILKAPGMTSNDVVYDVRRALSVKRVGHTGTLDPGAAGVLPVCVGKATKLFDYLMEKEKEYIAEAVFGIETDTLDSYGTITNSHDRIITRQEIEEVLQEYIGEIEQIAPMYSAVSVNGQRLYKLARKGIEVERKTRKAVIYDIKIIDEPASNRFLFKTRCSKGTYVRTLFNDIAHRLGTYAYISFLLRSASGRFDLSNSVTIDELKNHVENKTEDDVILPVDKALDFLPEISFSDNEFIYKKLINGAYTEYDGSGLSRVYYNNAFIGIGESKDKMLRIKTQFCEV